MHAYIHTYFQTIRQGNEDVSTWRLRSENCISISAKL